jgi:hypothetical protein
MQTRKKWLKMRVLNSFANDYEDFNIIVKTIDEWAAEENMSFYRSEIIETLTDVINEGYAQAFRLSLQKPYSVAVPFSPDNIDELRFYVTEKGKQEVNKDLDQDEQR